MTTWATSRRSSAAAASSNAASSNSGSAGFDKGTEAVEDTLQAEGVGVVGVVGRAVGYFASSKTRVIIEFLDWNAPAGQ